MMIWYKLIDGHVISKAKDLDYLYVKKRPKTY